MRRRWSHVACVALAGCAVAFGFATSDSRTAHAEDRVTPVANSTVFVSKKDAYLAKKSATPAAPTYDKEAWEKQLDRRLGKRPASLVNIYNTWTRETMAYERTRHPKFDLDKARNHLRCHFTGQPADLDARLYAALIRAAAHFRVERIEIVSGYRAPKYNLMLRKKGREVARNSQHTMGHAVDFRLPGIPTHKVRNWARRQRLGGVGYYPSSGFVHMDVGDKRYWRGH